MKIGNVSIEGNLVLAPMAAVNCAAFRLMCKENGASLVYSQMIDAEDFLQNNDKYLDFIEGERPVVGQLIGNKEDVMSEAAKILEKHVDIIDINFGCALGEYLGRKMGVYFMKHPEHISKIVKAVVGSVKCPVTCKIRSGWDSVNAVDVAKICEEAGASAISIHPRTRKQRYMDKADWNVVKDVKDNVSIPVIGNGDVDGAMKVKSIIARTKCDLVMIGRAAIGNPSIFKECRGFKIERTNNFVFDQFLHFLELYKKYQKRQKFTEIRDHACWFVKGLQTAKGLKEKLRECKNEDYLLSVLKKELLGAD